jgi:fructose-1,6-bisphosphatase/inositol monophosphatase family enzyme
MKGKTVLNKTRRTRVENYGVINANTVGIVMKEAVRRAMVFIRARRILFEARLKNMPGDPNDYVTNVDEGAQRIYQRTLTEVFPHFGLIGEENELRIEPNNPFDLRFCVDGVDGTSAFVRKESHGIGTMVALAQGAKIIAAYVGDVMTTEIFGFRPGSTKTHRIVDFGVSEHLAVDQNIPLSKQYVLLRDCVSGLSTDMQRIVKPGKIFRKHEIAGGSIGTWMARLWKGNVGGVVIDPCKEKPWDLWPVAGISEHMGFVPLRFNRRGKLVRTKWLITDETYRRDYEILVVHKSRVVEAQRLVF